MNNIASLNIDQSVFQPILEAEIKSAMARALGNPDALIEKLVNQVVNQKVNSSGMVSGSSYDNKHNLMDVVFRNTIHQIVKEEVQKFASEQGDKIRDAIKKHLSQKKNVDGFVDALMRGVVNGVSASYGCSIKLELQSSKD